MQKMLSQKNIRESLIKKCNDKLKEKQQELLEKIRIGCDMEVKNYAQRKSNMRLKFSKDIRPVPCQAK